MGISEAGLGKLNFNHIMLKNKLIFCKRNLICNNTAFTYVLLRFMLKDFNHLCVTNNIGLNYSKILNAKMSDLTIYRSISECFYLCAGLS